MATKAPAPLIITHAEITRRHVVIHYKNGTKDAKEREKDQPLPSFVAALAALGTLVLEICHLPKTYGANLRIRSVELNDKDQVSIKADKSFDDASAPLTIKTPFRFLALPTEEGTYTPPLKADQIALIETLVEEAKDYVKGQRAQGQLPFAADEDDEGEEETGGEEPLLEESQQQTEPKPESIAATAKNAKKTGAKAKPAAKGKGRSYAE